MTCNTLQYSKLYLKDIERCKRRHWKIEKLECIIRILEVGKILPLSSFDHSLKGDYVSLRECHIQPDWLLIYRVKDNVVYLYRTGSHSDLF